MSNALEILNRLRRPLSSLDILTAKSVDRVKLADRIAELIVTAGTKKKNKVPAVTIKHDALRDAAAESIKKVIQERLAELKEQLLGGGMVKAGEQAGHEFHGNQWTGQTGTPEFKEWFGDSKVVDGEGKPLVVYHGTENDVGSQFSEDRTHGRAGIYLTDSGKLAAHYATISQSGSPNIIPTFVSIKNPAPLGWRDMIQLRKEDVAELKKQGYDGIIADNPNGTKEFVAFHPTQIKSAIGNSGKFSKTDARITASSLDTNSTAKAIITNAKGQVLALKCANAVWWDLPGGHIHTGETPEEAVRREVTEETGLELQHVEVRVIPTRLILDEVETLCVFFDCTVATSKVKLSDEHSAYKWMNPPALKKLDFGVFAPFFVPERSVVNAGEAAGHVFHGNQWVEGDPVYYHGTTKDKVESIKKLGILPDSTGHAFAAGSKDAAKAYSNGKPNGIVLEIRPPKGSYSIHSPYGYEIAKFRGGIKSDWVKATTPTTIAVNLSAKKVKDSFVERFTTTVLEAEEEAFAVTHSGLLNAIGANETATDQGVIRDFVNTRENKIKDCAEGIYDRISSALKEGTDAGETMSELSDRMKNEFSSLTDERAELIARTETQSLYGTAQADAITRAGFKTKRWVTAGDERVRDSHVACGEEGEIPVDEEFSNGLMYPGDPDGEAGEVINCRCYLTAGTEADEGEDDIEARSHDHSYNRITAGAPFGNDNAAKNHFHEYEEGETKFKKYLDDLPRLQSGSALNPISKPSAQIDEEDLRGQCKRTPETKFVKISDLKTQQSHVSVSNILRGDRDNSIGKVLSGDNRLPAVFETQSGEMILTDGNHRTVGALARGRDEIKVRLYRNKKLS